MRVWAAFVLAFILMSAGAGAGATTIDRPEIFKFGSSVQSIQATLAPFCDVVSVRDIIPITAPLARGSQQQIDCSGFLYAGAKRDIELVFQDNQLDLVWILFPEQETGFFIKEFVNRYGPASMEIDFGVIFLQANAAVRRTPSEVLFVSDRQLEAMLVKLKS